MSKYNVKYPAIIIALGMAVGLSFAQPSSAGIIATVTYTGRATGILDPTGLFGVPTRMMFDADFVDVFKIDLSKGYVNYYDFGGIPEYQLLGGSYYFPTTPIVSSALIINGHTIQFNGDKIGQEFNREGQAIGSFAGSGAIGGQSGFSSQNNAIIETNAPLSLSSPYSGTYSPQFGFLGNVAICNITAVSSSQSNCYPGDETLRGLLLSKAVTIQISSSVPEPAAWLLMLAGFGAIGAALRVRNRRVAAIC